MKNNNNSWSDLFLNSKDGMEKLVKDLEAYSKTYNDWLNNTINNEISSLPNELFNTHMDIQEREKVEQEVTLYNDKFTFDTSRSTNSITYKLYVPGYNKANSTLYVSKGIIWFYTNNNYTNNKLLAEIWPRSAYTLDDLNAEINDGILTITLNKNNDAKRTIF